MVSRRGTRSAVVIGWLRATAGFLVQFGVAAKPEVQVRGLLSPSFHCLSSPRPSVFPLRFLQAKWQNAKIKDDPYKTPHDLP